VRSYLHKLSAFLFYLLGSSFFAAYLLHFNHLYGPWPQWWMSVADLPLILIAMLFGGTSLYVSVIKPGKKSAIASLVIGLPLTALFTFLVMLNFWAQISPRLGY